MRDVEFETALAILREEGHMVGGLSGSLNMIYARIDGRDLSRTEILELTKAPDSLWPFELCGKQCEMRVYYDHEGMAFEVRRDKKRVGERRRAPDTEGNDAKFANRLVAEMMASGELL